jgi:hypothetical protein
MNEQLTASVVFTVEELWMLQSAIRHEVAQMEQWKFPPASLDLNDQIAECILFCHEHSLTEGALVLSRGDCLVIDYCVPQSAKTASGAPIGKTILMKSYKARVDLAQGLSLSAVEPVGPTSAEVREQLRRMKED